MLNVAAADKSHVVRYAKSRVQRGFHSVHGKLIIEAKDAIRRFRQSQQIFHGGVGGRVCSVSGIVMRPHVLRPDWQTVFLQRTAIALQAAHGGAQAVAIHEGHAAATTLDQMLGGDHADGFIIHPYKVRGQTGQLAVNQHVRDVLLFNTPKALQRELRGGHNQRVHLARQ